MDVKKIVRHETLFLPLSEHMAISISPLDPRQHSQRLLERFRLGVLVGG